jgi:hypothetical protein
MRLRRVTFVNVMEVGQERFVNFWLVRLFLIYYLCSPAITDAELDQYAAALQVSCSFLLNSTRNPGKYYVVTYLCSR